MESSVTNNTEIAALNGTVEENKIANLANIVKYFLDSLAKGYPEYKFEYKVSIKG
jgi:hypothetical protein